MSSALLHKHGCLPESEADQADRLWLPVTSLILFQYLPINTGKFMGSLSEFICSFLLQSGSFPDHAEKMHELPDENLRDIVPIAKRIAIAQGTPDYKNILQNNGRIAHQVFTLL